MPTRREILTGCAAGAATLMGMRVHHAKAFEMNDNTAFVKILGWNIGPTLYTFHKFPFDEALQMAKASGSTSFSLKPGLPITRGSEEKVGPGMSRETRKRYRELLAETGIFPDSMGVCDGNKRETFEFAAENGIPIINVEPKPELLPEVNKMAEEYRIKVAIHNHPKPSTYWDPDVILERVRDCGPYIGACCDIGHWLRSGLDPVECLKKLKGRINSFHIKDLNGDKKDIPLGQGFCKIEEVLRECAAQHLMAPFSLEYESDWEANQPMVAEGIRFFCSVARKIVEEQNG